MNKIIFTIAISVITILHVFALDFIFEKKEIKIHKPKHQKISMQFARIKKPVIPKLETPPIEEKVFKPEVKEVFNKPIKKDAKRKLVKKKKKLKKKIRKKIHKKKIVKKKIRKKILKKRIEKKIVREEIVKKVIEKEILKAPVRKVEKPAIKNAVASDSLYNEVRKSYLMKLRRAIDRNKKYPKASKRLREQGTVVVSFRVMKNGTFTNMKIHKSSSKKRLDKAALKALLKTKNFKSFPKEMSHKQFMDFTLAIKFRLK